MYRSRQIVDTKIVSYSTMPVTDILVALRYNNNTNDLGSTAVTAFCETKLVTMRSDENDLFEFYQEGKDILAQWQCPCGNLHTLRIVFLEKEA